MDPLSKFEKATAAVANVLKGIFYAVQIKGHAAFQALLDGLNNML